MADEPRRSGRPTKGVHTKMDIDQTPEPKKKGGKKGKKQAVQEEDTAEETIRCVCGARATLGVNDPEPWIACDACISWQHNVCMGISTFEEEIPKKYLCEECGPDDHQELLASMARGEHIWEDRRKAHEEMQAQEASKKKGKKGKGKRQSDQKEVASNGQANSSATQADRKETPVRAGSTKRKARDDSQETPVEHQAKARKVSTAHVTPKQKSPPSGLPVKIVELESARQGVAKLLKTRLLEGITVAVKNSVYACSPGENRESKSERLAIQVESAVYGTTPNKDAYASQCRMIVANLKTNQELCNGLLTKKLMPADLAIMTSDDMMTSELKHQTEEMKALADKQAVMITDDGPRVRRTHKGEELVGGDSFVASSDGAFSASRRRSQLSPNGGMGARSRENSPQNEVELPGDIYDHRSHDDIRGHAVPKQPLNIQTKPAPIRKASTQNDFDFNKVMSSVQSPTGPNSTHIRRPSGNAPPAHGPGEDADVDRLLEDDMDSDEYSPVGPDTDPDIVWRGVVNMDSVAKFPAVARHAAGADLTRTMNPPIPYSDLLQKEMKIAGRIDIDKANEYLCSLRYAPQLDVIIVTIDATGEKAQEGFKEIFEYFYTKARYGVLTNRSTVNIRDTYLVPIPASPAPLPDFIPNLEGHKISEHRDKPMLCIALVVKAQWEALQDQNFESAGDTDSPLQNLPQRQMSISGTGPSMSPITAQGSFPGPHPTTPSSYTQTPEEAHRRMQDEQRRLAQEQGLKMGERILGHFMRAPTIQFIIPQAYQMREIEWEVIRSILETDERAQQDLQHLSQVLDRKMNQRNADELRQNGNGNSTPAVAQ